MHHRLPKYLLTTPGNTSCFSSVWNNYFYSVIFYFNFEVKTGFWIPNLSVTQRPKRHFTSVCCKTASCSRFINIKFLFFSLLASFLSVLSANLIEASRLYLLNKLCFGFPDSDSGFLRFGYFSIIFFFAILSSSAFSRQFSGFLSSSFSFLLPIYLLLALFSFLFSLSAFIFS